MRTIVLGILFLILTSWTWADVAANSEWKLFRGNPQQNGVVEGKLPDPLEELWRFKAKDSVEGAVAVAKGVVYFGSFDQYLYALNLKDGSVKWKSKLGPIKASPTIHGTYVYVGDAEGKFFCVDAEKGDRIWTFESEAEITSGANFWEDRILIGSHDSNLYCLDKAGKKIWDFKIEGPVNGSPAVADGKTFIAGCDSNLHIIDIKTGKSEVAIDLGGQAGATAAVRGTNLYVGTMTNEVLGIDLKTQKIMWRYTAAKRQLPFYASAAVTDNLVVVGGRDKLVHALDRQTGTMKWTYLTEGRVDSSPVIVGDRVLAGSMDSHLYVLDLNKGTELQKIELDSSILGSPAVVDGKVLISTEKGTVYCFGKK